MGKTFMREKKVDCGDYREVDIIPRTENADKAAKGKRGEAGKGNGTKAKEPE